MKELKRYCYYYKIFLWISISNLPDRFSASWRSKSWKSLSLIMSSSLQGKWRCWYTGSSQILLCGFYRKERQLFAIILKKILKIHKLAPVSIMGILYVKFEPRRILYKKGDLTLTLDWLIVVFCPAEVDCDASH